MRMLKPALIVAGLIQIIGSFSLWFSMGDFERARYFPVLSGLPQTTFMLAGFLGKSGQAVHVPGTAKKGGSKLAPIAAVGAVAAASTLWFSMDDYARARYFSILTGVPHSAFTLLGFAGQSGDLPMNILKRVR